MGINDLIFSRAADCYEAVLDLLAKCLLNLWFIKMKKFSEATPFLLNFVLLRNFDKEEIVAGCDAIYFGEKYCEKLWYKKKLLLFGIDGPDGICDINDIKGMIFCNWFWILIYTRV